MNRMEDMVNKYGEVCDQKDAAAILNVVPRTIARMMDDGRLRRVGHRVDVRSICEYIEHPEQTRFAAKVEHHIPRTQVSQGDFLAAAHNGRWNRK